MSKYNDRQHKERKFWDRFANTYDSFIKKIFGRTYSSILENLDSELDTSNSVLDIGTGTGIIPFFICSKVAFVDAIDISPEMIRLAYQKQKRSNIQNINFQVQDSYNLTFTDKTFDIVIASNLLHLLYETDKSIYEVKRVMKDDGIFIAPTLCVGEKAQSSFISSIIGAVSGFKIVNKWSIDEFKTMLMDYGFIINKIVKIDGRFPLVYVVLRKNPTII